LLVAEMAGHALAGEDVPGALVLARRAGGLVRDRVAVARALRVEVVALDDAGKALADRHALHIDALPDLENGPDVELAAGLEVGELIRLRAELAQRLAGLDARLGEMAGEGLVDARGTALAESHLHGGVAVRLGGLDLRHAVVRHIEDRDGRGGAVVGKDASHADLAADQSDAHTFLFCLVRLLPPGAGCNWPALHLLLRATEP